MLAVAPESAQAALMLDAAVIEAESLASALAAAAPATLPALRTARFRHAAGEHHATVSELATAHGALARAASLD